MLNNFMPDYVWRSTRDCSKATQNYRDFDSWYFYKMDNFKINDYFRGFHVYEEGDSLIVELDPNTEETREALSLELADLRESMGYSGAEYEIFEPIYTNGLDFVSLDEIGGLSEAPAFMDTVYLPDWIESVKRMARDYHDSLINDYAAIDWTRTKVWSAIEYYQIRSPLDCLVESGRCEFKLA